MCLIVVLPMAPNIWGSLQHKNTQNRSWRQQCLITMARFRLWVQRGLFNDGIFYTQYLFYTELCEWLSARIPYVHYSGSQTKLCWWSYYHERSYVTVILLIHREIIRLCHWQGRNSEPQSDLAVFWLDLRHHNLLFFTFAKWEEVQSKVLKNRKGLTVTRNK